MGVSAGLDTEMVIAEVAAAYEFARWNGMTPQVQPPRSTFTPAGGPGGNVQMSRSPQPARSTSSTHTQQVGRALG